MLRDLAALTPPLIVCVAFLIGVFLFLRWQMRSGQRRDGSTEGKTPDLNSLAKEADSSATDPAPAPSSDSGHSAG